MRTLERAGHNTIFTLSGNHIMSLFDAAIETRHTLVHTRHEAAAVHMADAWGRLTGEPGIAMVTGGPGHANAADHGPRDEPIRERQLRAQAHEQVEALRPDPVPRAIRLRMDRYQG